MDNYSFANRIEAIKAVRSIEAIQEETTDSYGRKCFRIRADIGLLAAKRMVEAIISLALSETSKDTTNAVLDLENRNKSLAEALDKANNAYYMLRSRLYSALDSVDDIKNEGQ